MFDTDYINYTADTAATNYTTTYTTTANTNDAAWTGNYIYHALNTWTNIATEQWNTDVEHAHTTAETWAQFHRDVFSPKKRTKKHRVNIDTEQLLALL